MADNYLEKRYEEVFSNNSPASGKSAGSGRPSLDRLLLDNRSCRGYDKSYVVHPLQLEAIVSVNTRIASGNNAQRLRFRLVTKGPEADEINRHIHMGGAIPELHLPFPGTEPEAFIIVCSTCGENAIIDIDAGISLQSMLLKATEMHLSGLIIRNFDKEAIGKFTSALTPIAVLAIGKSAEKCKLVPATSEADPQDKGAKTPGEQTVSLKYYREGGVHCVPKLGLEDLLIR